MMLTPDEVIFREICATDYIETILDRFGRFNTISCTNFMENQPVSCSGHWRRHIYTVKHRCQRNAFPVVCLVFSMIELVHKVASVAIDIG